MFYDDEEYHNNAPLNNRNNNYAGVSEEDRRLDSRRIQRDSSERTWMMEVGASAAIIFYISLNLGVYHKEVPCGDF